MTARLLTIISETGQPMLSLEPDTVSGADRFKLDGRLGANESQEMAARLVSVLDAGTGTLHLDLQNLTFMDSSGLSSLVSLLKHARRSGGDVILFNANARIRSLFELTRLHEIFEMRDDASLPKASGFR